MLDEFGLNISITPSNKVEIKKRYCRNCKYHNLKCDACNLKTPFGTIPSERFCDEWELYRV